MGHIPPAGLSDTFTGIIPVTKPFWSYYVHVAATYVFATPKVRMYAPCAKSKFQPLVFSGQIDSFLVETLSACCYSGRQFKRFK